MFKGTVRSNLDPFGEASDNELWHALKLVHLRDAIAGEQLGWLGGWVVCWSVGWLVSGFVGGRRLTRGGGA